MGGVLLIELRRQRPRVSFHLGKFHRQRAAGAQGRSRTDGLSLRGRPRYPAAPLGLGRAYLFIWKTPSRRAAGAPLRIRTETERLLEPPPLPVGLGASHGPGESNTRLRFWRPPSCRWTRPVSSAGRPLASRAPSWRTWRFLGGGAPEPPSGRNRIAMRLRPPSSRKRVRTFGLRVQSAARCRLRHPGVDTPRIERGTSSPARPLVRLYRRPRWAPRGLNAQPPAFQTGALPIELSALRGPGTTRTSDRLGVNQLL